MTQLLAGAATPDRDGAAACGSETLASATASLNSWIEVDLDALAHNAGALRSFVSPSELIAVVKANAYGAGIRGVAPALENAGVDRFAVVWVQEAVELRALGVSRPILVLGHANESDIPVVLQYDITLTCDTLALGRKLAADAFAAGKRAKVHIHVDTGLHRDGLTPDAAIRLAQALRDLPGLDVEGLSTHMANADEADDSFSGEQEAAFAAVCDALPWIRYRHAANSATALRRPGARLTGVRVGLALHGVQPDFTPEAGLRPVLQLKSHLIRIVDVAPGEGASYGLTWRAGRPSRLGLVPVGYADGWRRGLGNTGHVLVRGIPCPMVGRVCMDQFLVDVTDVQGAATGDEAVLIGAQGAAEITAEAVARTAGTIPWDVLSSLQARLPRLFHRDGIVETRQ
ncbi:MAG: alanine racemase [Dehalococcoidia bacterium]|nr:alanine racemase [Dehalococcoidia bacterium]MCB9486322.1 alanine racemase [Thermoflexaceae bacterium]